MYSHLRAVALATGTLVLLGMIHAVSSATEERQSDNLATPAQAGSPVKTVQVAEVRSITGVSMRAVAIGY